MIQFSGLFIILLVVLMMLIELNKARVDKRRNNLLTRFRKKFNYKNRLKDRLKESFQNSLMFDPEKDIKIGDWDTEIELREKVDIHRARLNRYGRSRLNGELLFQGPKGGIFKYNSNGKRKYI